MLVVGVPLFSFSFLRLFSFFSFFLETELLPDLIRLALLCFTSSLLDSQ